MNFFKSVFSDDADPPESKPESESSNATQNNERHDPDGDSSPPPEHRSPSPDDSDAGRWNFGGLIKTWTAKSESIIETYRRDLQEFGTGLKKEIEVAHGSLESVGLAIDEFGNTVVTGTAQILSQGKDAILAADLDSDSDNSNNHKHRHSSEKGFLNSKGYSRFDSQVRAIQGDVGTYSEEPGDLDDYSKWKSGFSLEGKSEEIESFLRENDAMESIYKRVVPNTVDHETFWYRYYYKVYRLKKAEDVRARLVRRMSKEGEEEDLSWDVEDDDDDDDQKQEYEGNAKPQLMINKEDGGANVGKRVDTPLQIGSLGTKTSNVEELHNSGKEETVEERREILLQSKELGNKTDNSIEESKVENSEVIHEMGDRRKETIEEAGFESFNNASKLEVDNTVNKNGSAAESDEKVMMERKADDGKSSNNDSSLVGGQHSEHEEEEEDLGWDEIEDLSSIDEKKATQTRSPSKDDLRKRLSAAEEEEDLSWDIEDDDESAKA